MESKTKISIKNLYKIFGKNPNGLVSEVKNGISKKELLEKFNWETVAKKFIVVLEDTLKRNNET